MQIKDDILSLIPHRPPFLWVDKIVSFEDGLIITEKHFPDDLDIFAGHYPGNPMMPGVLLCEAIFQSGALLVAKMNSQANLTKKHTPVLTRISNAKFKRLVLPGDTVQVEVKLIEMISTACYFKGVLKVGGKVAIMIDFACKMVTPTA